jgi:hypothetical protein
LSLGLGEGCQGRDGRSETHEEGIETKEKVSETREQEKESWQ